MVDPRNAIDEALLLLPAKMDSKQARVMMLAIGLQESRFEHRRQIGGPARGFWQFEKGGGVRGVLSHPSTKLHALAVCNAVDIHAREDDVYQSLEHDDVLAAAFARLLLFSDAQPLSELGDAEGAWAYYLRTWRPGRPHRHTWDDLYAKALEMAA